MILRPSQQLNARVKSGPLAALPLDANPLADWSARLFYVDRIQHHLLTNTRTLYSVVFLGQRLTERRRFVDRATEALREFMERDGLGAAYKRFIAPSTADVQWARALNRSVTGSMNDLIFQATYDLTHDKASVADLGFRLNETPMSAIGKPGRSDLGIPRDVFKETIDSLEPS